MGVSRKSKTRRQVYQRSIVTAFAFSHCNSWRACTMFVMHRQGRNGKKILPTPTTNWVNTHSKQRLVSEE